MQDRFIPPGYIGIEKAILRISKTMAPVLWQAVPTAELAVWDETVGALRGLDLLPKLVVYLQQSAVVLIDNPRLRYFFFRAAVLDLRERLFDQKVTAYCFGPN